MHDDAYQLRLPDTVLSFIEIYSTFSFSPITHTHTHTLFYSDQHNYKDTMNSQITCHPLHFIVTKTAIKTRSQSTFILSLAPNLTNFAFKGYY